MLQDDLVTPTVHVVAIFARQTRTTDEWHAIMHKYIKHVGIIPTLLLIPSDGPTAVVEWAELLHIQVRSCYAAWKKGKFAGHVRDELMIRECTHVLIDNEVQARGKQVVYVRELLERPEAAHPCAQAFNGQHASSVPHAASGRARKSSTKREPMSQRCQTTAKCSK